MVMTKTGMMKTVNDGLGYDHLGYDKEGYNQKGYNKFNKKKNEVHSD